MGAFRRLLYHIVLTPYKRENVLKKDNRERLFRYIYVVSKNLGCPIYAINGIENHIHILVTIKHDILISDYLRKIKVASSKFIKEERLFPLFKKWAVGYSIFTCNYKAKDSIIEYINNQEEHHKIMNLYDEMHDILDENGFLERSTPLQGRG